MPKKEERFSFQDSFRRKNGWEEISRASEPQMVERDKKVKLKGFPNFNLRKMARYDDDGVCMCYHREINFPIDSNPVCSNRLARQGNMPNLERGIV